MGDNTLGNALDIGGAAASLGGLAGLGTGPLGMGLGAASAVNSASNEQGKLDAEGITGPGTNISGIEAGLNSLGLTPSLFGYRLNILGKPGLNIFNTPEQQAKDARDHYNLNNETINPTTTNPSLTKSLNEFALANPLAFENTALGIIGMPPSAPDYSPGSISVTSLGPSWAPPSDAGKWATGQDPNSLGGSLSKGDMAAYGKGTPGFFDYGTTGTYGDPGGAGLGAETGAGTYDYGSVGTYGDSSTYGTTGTVSSGGAAMSSGEGVSAPGSEEAGVDESGFTADTDTGDGGDGGGGGGSVLCTELHRQGKLCDEWFKADMEVGRKFSKQDPYVITGYHFWGKPLARLMKKSTIITYLVSLLALPWAKEMYIQQGNSEISTFRGRFLCKFGLPICRMIGKTLNSRKVQYVKSS